MIGKYAGFAEGIELSVGSYQLAYRRSCIRLRQAEGDFADDSVAFISPSVGIAELGNESQHDKQNAAHWRILSRLRMIIASFCDYPVNCFTFARSFLCCRSVLRGVLGSTRSLAGKSATGRLLP
jgi:hypothetical protein